ncbi:MAG: DUF1573 domain-containing protein [Saprospiraceae bacterium]|nr:DUF1573 domain-containing protein [Saprospiraceae bacterium]
MKFFLLICTLGLFLTACGDDNKGESIQGSSSVSPDKAATMEFEETAHNFGEIKEGEKVSHVFKFKNTSSNPLTISNATGSCGCTVPDYPKAPINPGETGEIKVTFNSKGKKGEQSKNVTIEANTIPSKNRLKIYADVLVEEDS